MGGVYLYLSPPDLKAQTSNYLGLSAEYTIGKLAIMTSAYYNKVDNAVAHSSRSIDTGARQTDGSMRTMRVRQCQNIEDAKTYGVDLTCAIRGATSQAGGSYSYLDTKANSNMMPQRTSCRLLPSTEWLTTMASVPAT